MMKIITVQQVKQKQAGQVFGNQKQVNKNILIKTVIMFKVEYYFTQIEVCLFFAEYLFF